MRRILSYMLLAFFLFNTVGYYFFYQAIRSHTNSALLKRLDNDIYSSEETVTIKLPLAIPYQSNTEYERVDGSFEHQGEFYKLVKQKIENDTLFVVCYRDHSEKKISGLLADFVKATNDLPLSKSSALKLLNSFSKDYELSKEISFITFAELIQDSFHPYPVSFLKDYTKSVVSPPPEA